MTIIEAADVERLLTYPAAVQLMTEAMRALSAGATRQLPRTLIPLTGGAFFGLMPGALAADGWFGAKLVSVMPDRARPGRSHHRGVVALFEPAGGHPVAIADAEAITLRRTAAASAAATDALARPDAATLAILGCGAQALAHAEAIATVRRLQRIVVWGRSPERAAAAAARIGAATGIETLTAPSAAAAVADAAIVCTVTGSKQPILCGDWVAPGAHVNLVGASGADAAEADATLVVRSRYFVESRESALDKAGEFLRAKAAGLIDDDHIAAEIGEVMAGAEDGRRSTEEVTVYKSVGHAVQDLAAAAFLFERLRAEAGAPAAPPDNPGLQ